MLNIFYGALIVVNMLHTIKKFLGGKRRTRKSKRKKIERKMNYYIYVIIIHYVYVSAII